MGLKANRGALPRVWQSGAAYGGVALPELRGSARPDDRATWASPASGGACPRHGVVSLAIAAERQHVESVRHRILNRDHEHKARGAE